MACQHMGEIEWPKPTVSGTENACKSLPKPKGFPTTNPAALMEWDVVWLIGFIILYFCSPSDCFSLLVEVLKVLAAYRYLAYCSRKKEESLIILFVVILNVQIVYSCICHSFSISTFICL
jgi:hypothetical protein